MNSFTVILIELGKEGYCLNDDFFIALGGTSVNSPLSFVILRFNENPFHKDLEASGIDLDLKLTRKEWNAIRRTVRKPPRRFSRAFIDKEFDKLNKYRKEVRQIQKLIHMGGAAGERNFDFEGKTILVILLISIKKTPKVF